MQPKTNICTSPTERVPPASADLDIFAYKRLRLLDAVTGASGGRGNVGLPLQLSMYEQFPLWAGFFETAGFKVVLSDPSAHTLYPERLSSDISEKLCYPAKLMNSHIESLLDSGVNFIYLPCDEYAADGNYMLSSYNCSVTAFYPELLRVSCERLNEENFLSPYINLDNRKTSISKLYSLLRRFGVKKREISKGLKEGFSRLESYRSDVKAKADEILYKAERQNRKIVIIAGRPYHSDSAVNHGIIKQCLSRGLAVLSADCIGEASSAAVSNHWAYHAELFRAAEFAASRNNVYLVHLVSAECKFDEVISEQIRFITERQGKSYTRIILDEKAARVL